MWVTNFPAVICLEKTAYVVDSIRVTNIINMIPYIIFLLAMDYNIR